MENEINDTSNNIDNDELLMELSECRNDERDCKSQMIQVISTAGAILGVLFGSTYFPFGKEIAGIHFDRIIFYLSIVVFCVAFTYIIVNNPESVSLLSGDRKPQIRFLGNHHSGGGNLYHKSFRM